MADDRPRTGISVDIKTVRYDVNLHTEYHWSPSTLWTHLDDKDEARQLLYELIAFLKETLEKERIS